MKIVRLSLLALFSLIAIPAFAAAVDCSDAYGKPMQCEQIACSERYQTFLGNWSGPFQSYSQELSTQNAAVFRPYQNETAYGEKDCLKNTTNGDVFIIGRRTDVYPEFRGLAPKESKGMLIPGRNVDGTPFLRTFDAENGFGEYELVYQNIIANISIWQLTIPASPDGKSPEMRFTTIDGQNFQQEGINRRDVTVTMSMGPKQKPLWEGVIAKGHHSLSVAQSADTISYFLGEVKFSSPTGEAYGSSVSLVKRVVSKSNGKITEYVLDIEEKEKPIEYVTVFEITGSTFKVHDELGTFSGEGQLIGEEWAWSGWKYSVQMKDGSGTLRGDDSLSPDGITIKKTFSSPDGQPRVLFSEELKPISESMYQLLKAKM